MLTDRNLEGKSTINISHNRYIIFINRGFVINAYTSTRNRNTSIPAQASNLSCRIPLGPIFPFLIFQVAYYVSIIRLVIFDISCNCSISCGRKNISTIIYRNTIKGERGNIFKIYIINYCSTHPNIYHLLVWIKLMHAKGRNKGIGISISGIRHRRNHIITILIRYS